MQFTKTLVFVWGAFAGAIFCLCVEQAGADIYSYTDERGVIHFSNVPTSPKYRLKIREYRFDYKRLSSGAYDELIRKACTKHGVDPMLVKAIIRAESDFDPMAVSVDGARGLMQLMPDTAYDMGVNDVHDPKENIDGGVRYLKRLMGMFKADLTLVVAAYNAGETAVMKYKAVPPFKETQEYVKKVLGYLKNSHLTKRTKIELAQE